MLGAIRRLKNGAHFVYRKKTIFFPSADAAKAFQDHLKTLDKESALLIIENEFCMNDARAKQEPPLTCSLNEAMIIFAAPLKHNEILQFPYNPVSKKTFVRKRNSKSFCTRDHLLLLGSMLCFSATDSAGGLLRAKLLLDQSRNLIIAINEKAASRNHFLVEYLMRGLVWGQAFSQERPDSDLAFSMFTEFLTHALTVLKEFDSAEDSVVQFKREAYQFITQIPDRKRAIEPMYRKEERLKADLDALGNIRRQAHEAMAELPKATKPIQALVHGTHEALIATLTKAQKTKTKKHALATSAPSKRKKAKCDDDLIPGDAKLCKMALPEVKASNVYPRIECTYRFKKAGVSIEKTISNSVPHTRRAPEQDEKGLNSLAKWKALIPKYVEAGITYTEMKILQSHDRRGVKGASVSLGKYASKSDYQKLSISVVGERKGEGRLNSRVLVPTEGADALLAYAREQVKKYHAVGVSVLEITKQVAKAVRAHIHRDKLPGLVRPNYHKPDSPVHYFKYTHYNQGEKQDFELKFNTKKEAEAFQKALAKKDRGQWLDILREKKRSQLLGVLTVSYSIQLKGRSLNLQINVKPALRKTYFQKKGTRFFALNRSRIKPYYFDLLGASIVISGNPGQEINKALLMMAGLERVADSLKRPNLETRLLLLRYVQLGIQNLYHLDSAVPSGFFIHYQMNTKARDVSLLYLENVLKWLDSEAQAIQKASKPSMLNLDFAQTQRALYERILEIKKFQGSSGASAVQIKRLKSIKEQAKSALERWNKAFKPQIVLLANWDNKPFKGDETALRHELRDRLKALIKISRARHPLGQIIISTPEDFLQYPITDISAFEAMLTSIAVSDPNCLIQLNARVVETVSGAAVKAERLAEIKAQYRQVEALNVGNDGAVAHYLTQAESALGGAAGETSCDPVYVISHQTVLAANSLGGAAVKIWRQSKKAPFAGIQADGSLQSSETVHLELPEHYPRVFEVLPKGVILSDEKIVSGVSVVSETCLEHVMKARNKPSGLVHSASSVSLISSNGIVPEAVGNPTGSAGTAYGLSVSNDLYRDPGVFGGSAKSREGALAYRVCLNAKEPAMVETSIKKSGDLSAYVSPALAQVSEADLVRLLGVTLSEAPNVICRKRKSGAKRRRHHSPEPSPAIAAAEPVKPAPCAGAGCAAGWVTPFRSLSPEELVWHQRNEQNWIEGYSGLPVLTEDFPFTG